MKKLLALLILLIPVVAYTWDSPIQNPPSSSAEQIGGVYITGNIGATLNVAGGGTLGSAAFKDISYFQIAGAYVPETRKIYIGGTGYSMSSDITVSNVSVTGTTGSTLNIGAGGTLGSAAYQASTAFQAAGSYVPATRKIVFNGTEYALSDDVTITVEEGNATVNITDVVESPIVTGGCMQMNAAGTKMITLASGCGSSGGGVTAVTGNGTSGIESTGGTTPAISCKDATGAQKGCLTTALYNTFNNKQNALGYTPENVANKGVANGYAGLDSGGKVPWANLSGVPSFAAVATSGAYADLSGKPSLATVATSGAYGDLSGKPDLAAVATTGSYTSLIDKPTYATVATTGDYEDLINKPVVTTMGRLLKTTILTDSSGVFTTTAKTASVYIRAVGAGGGGGGAKAGVGKLKVGAGGNNGNYFELTKDVSPSTGYNYTVGSGGTAGDNTGGNGGKGGDTTITIGTAYTAAGGYGGYGDTDTTSTAVITRSNSSYDTPSTGDLYLVGECGGYGLRLSGLTGISGRGGSGPMGAGGHAFIASGNGKPGTGYGSGGSGGVGSTNGYTGGVGANGAIIIQEFSVEDNG